MKKLIILLLLIFICFNFSCEKDNCTYMPDPLVKTLHSFIDNMDELTVDEISSHNYFNYENPFENLYIVFDGTIIKAINNKEINKGADIEDLFSQEFLSSFPSIDPESLNEETGMIMRKIDRIFLSYEANNCIPRLKLIENFIISNTDLNHDYSDLLLSYTMFLRHCLIMREKLENSNKADDVPWDECMINKMENLRSCKDCFIERIYFTFTFPIGFSIWAADCGIAALKKES